MDLNNLALFVRVVDCHGFSAAARATGIAKSSISDRISALEEDMGASLLRRSSRSFSVTDLGRQVYAHARAILDEAEELDVLLQSRVANQGGTIRISSSSTTYISGLAEVLCGFAAEFPNVDLRLHSSNSSVDLVDDGFDLAVRAHTQQLPSSGLIQKRLGFSPRWLVASAAYLKRKAPPLEPADLAAHVGLVMTAMVEAQELLLRSAAGSERRVRMISRIASDDPHALKAAAASGLGIAALPAGLCRSALQEGPGAGAPGLVRRRRRDQHASALSPGPGAFRSRARNVCCPPPPAGDGADGLQAGAIGTPPGRAGLAFGLPDAASAPVRLWRPATTPIPVASENRRITNG